MTTRLIVIESIHGCWNYAPAQAPASFLRCLRYDVDGLPTLEAAILAAERDESIPRPIHYTPEFAPNRSNREPDVQAMYAASDLLAAAQMFVAAVDMWQDDDNPMDGSDFIALCETTAENARAAIAKATGEA